jgi:hypothetical protein
LIGPERRGFIIDLDYAIYVDRSTGPQNVHRTGTLPFMSIHVLEAGDEEYDHTYHDDIESFFYVFLWFYCNWERLRVVRKERRLKEWM